jgi:hypothetical protein
VFVALGSDVLLGVVSVPLELALEVTISEGAAEAVVEAAGVDAAGVGELALFVGGAILVALGAAPVGCVPLGCVVLGCVVLGGVVTLPFVASLGSALSEHDSSPDSVPVSNNDSPRRAGDWKVASFTSQLLPWSTV